MVSSLRTFLALSIVLVAAAPALGAGFTIDVDGTLYSIDCRTSKAVKIGVVRAGGGPALVLTDLGTGPRGGLYGISSEGLFAINLKDPGASRKIGDHGLAGPYGFCVSPDGAGYANTADGQLCRIDLATGKATRVGAMGGGFHASGDLVFVGDKLYSSVKDAEGVETLVTIDLKTGAAKRIGAIVDGEGKNVANVFGLIYEDGLFGLTAGGSVVSIEPETAKAALLVWLPIRFWGASDALVIL